MLAPVIPIHFVLKRGLPIVQSDSSLSREEVAAAVTTARGGDFVSALQVWRGDVNAPFTYIVEIGPENIPYEGSLESQSDIIVGYGDCGRTDWQMHCASYRVYLKRTPNGWKVVSKAFEMT